MAASRRHCPPAGPASAAGRRRSCQLPMTVNLPECPITYLFWVLTLCTKTAAQVCFFRKRLKKKNVWEKGRKSTPLHFVVLCCACMCLPEGIRPVGSGDLCPELRSTLRGSPALHLDGVPPRPQALWAQALDIRPWRWLTSGLGAALHPPLHVSTTSPDR